MRARAYLARLEAAAGDGERPDRDLRAEALGSVLLGETPLLVTAHRAHDLLTALRIAEEFDLRVVLDGAGKPAAQLMTKKLAASNPDVAAILAREQRRRRASSHRRPLLLLLLLLPRRRRLLQRN